MIFKHLRSSGPLLAGAFAVLLGLSAPAADASVSYSFTTTTGNAAAQSYLAPGGTPVTLSAWSNGGAGGTMVQGSLSFWGSSGVGVNNGFGSSTDPSEGVSPEHAIDNNGLTDGVLLNFGVGNLFTMNSFSIGWFDSDADIVVLAYTGAGTPALGSSTLSGLLSSGWSGKKYSDVNSLGTNVAVNTALSLSSQYWLVLAYNSAFAGLSSGLGSLYGAGNDAFKFNGVTGNLTSTSSNISVPLPATTALLGVGALAFWRRRYQRQNS